jgi:hypothetical protein
MKQKTSRIVIALAVAVFALISILVLFSSAFSDTARGSGFEVAFGLIDGEKYPIPELIVAFGLECLGFILSFVSLPIKGKAKSVVFFINVLVLASAGILFCFAVSFYQTWNLAAQSGQIDNYTIGTGYITSIVFAFLGAATSFIGGLLARND